MARAPAPTETTAFETLVSDPDETLDLARIALAIAADAYPGLDQGVYLARLDAMAHAVKNIAGTGATQPVVLAALDHYLFEVEQFTGNAAAYYDRRNSFINEVLDRRTGIPITLCLVYLEIGWRLGLALAPVSFPAHFLVAEGVRERSIIDPFNAGARLSEADLVARLAPLLGNSAPAAVAYLPQALAPASRREVATRILRNLHAIYWKSNAFERALQVCNRMIALNPEDSAAIRDRGQVLERLECYQAAYHDLQHYLTLVPGARDAKAVAEKLDAMRPLATRLH